MKDIESTASKFVKRTKNYNFNTALTTLIPDESPSAEYFRTLIIEIVNTNFKLELDLHSSLSESFNFDVGQLTAAIDVIEKEQKRLTYPTTYMLAIFLSKHSDIDKVSKVLQVTDEINFLSCILVILLLNAHQETRVNDVCTQLRITLDEHKKVLYIFEFFVNKHKNVASLAKLATLLEVIEEFEDSKYHINSYSTQRVRKIRLAYRDAIEDKTKEIRPHQIRTRTNIKKDIGEGLCEIQFFDQSTNNKSFAQEEAMDASVCSLIKPDDNKLDGIEEHHDCISRKIRSIYRDEYYFSSNDKILPTLSYQKLVKYLYSNIANLGGLKITDESVYDTLILTSILTGRSLTKILDEIYSKKST